MVTSISRKRQVANIFKFLLKEPLLNSERLEPIIILAGRRTGSTLLSSYLGSLPSIHSQGELLNPDIYPFLGLFSRIPVGKQLALLYLKSSSLNSPSCVPSFKLIFEHLEMLSISLEDLQEAFPLAKFIIVYRHSLLESYVSLLKARKTREWFSTKADLEKEDFRFTLDANDFLDFCKDAKSKYKKCGSAGITKNSVVIEYQELASNPKALFQEKLCPFLGIEFQPIKTSLKKQSKGSISTLITNFDEIHKVLENQITSIDFDHKSGTFM